MSTSELRQTARDIFNAGLAAADPYRLLRELSRLEGRRWTCETAGGKVHWDLPDTRSSSRLLVAGAGKAAAFLAKALEESLGARITSGRVVVKHGGGMGGSTSSTR